MTIEQILAKSAQMHKLKKDPGFLFAELQNVTPEVLDEWEQVWAPKEDFWPVITLRYLVLQKLRQKEAVNQETIEELKTAITKRDISAYGEFNDKYITSLNNYTKKDKGMFHQWVDPFCILYQFFYTQQEKNDTHQLMKDLGNDIIGKYGLEDSKVHIVGFDGPQNYGSSRAWAVVIPTGAKGPRDAYQILFAAKDGELEGGFTIGHSLNDEHFVEEKKVYNDWRDLIEDVQHFLPKWKNLNSQLNFSLSKDESALTKVLSKIKPEDRDIYFALMDKLITEIIIPDEENLVFSTAGSQLSFQIGKRYCLNLKRDRFSFIAPINYILEGFQKEHFTHGHEAFLYHGCDREEIIKHYLALAGAVQSELERGANVFEKPYDNAAFRQAVFDKEYRNTLFTATVKPVFPQQPTKIVMPEESTLNLIMFGPPGTGKTYHTVGEAMKAAAPDIYAKYADADHRDRLREEFTRLLIKDWDDPKGQIAFCTFHQSFSYEDFVEGIKPETGKEGNITYIIEDGIFKRICDLAESNFSTIKMIKEGILSWSKNDFKNATFYKISLGDVTKPTEREIYEYCKDNNCITIGSTVNMDYSGYSERKIYEKCEEQGLTKVEALQLNYFIHSLKTGHYVLVSHGNKYLRAIGRITGKYEYNENPPIRYNHFRSVEWLFVDKKIPVNEVYDRPFTQNTLYKIDEKGLQEDFFTGKGQKESVEQKEDKRFVLIIDEINRGNIANIFGELITLIEKDKRAGQSEELEVILPYSKSKFKVPPNLFIIGTMNTADRSIEALDTALRRRFSFKEMPPRPELIRTEGALKETDGKIGDIDVVKLLETINKRLEKLIDKDHRIGHSYFMHIKTEPELKVAFRDKVIPLLEEYFFGDFGKIGLVLGSSFVEKVKENTVFASFNDYGDSKQDLAERPVYIIKDSSVWNFISIYE